MCDEDWTPEAMREAGFSELEIAAIGRDEAGVYRLSNTEIAAITDSGTWPVHPDPTVVVEHQVYSWGEMTWVRWWRRAE